MRISFETLLVLADAQDPQAKLAIKRIVQYSHVRGIKYWTVNGQVCEEYAGLLAPLRA